MSSVGAALAEWRGRLPAGEVRLLLGAVLNQDAVQLMAHPEQRLSPGAAERFAGLAARRLAGEPIAYLLGRREFYGRDFRVGPGVLIPRPETELLVEIAMAKLRGRNDARILDLGTGSGCVAITLALEVAGSRVTGVDASSDALAIARANGERLGAAVEFMVSDWFRAVAGRFHVVVGNPPYVAENDAHLTQGDLRFEPMSALASGTDGLDAIRRIVTAAPGHLESGGWLLLEHGFDQGNAVADLISAAGFREIEQHRDLAGLPRVCGGRLT